MKESENKWNEMKPCWLFVRSCFFFSAPWKGQIHCLWHSQWNCGHRRRQCPTLPFWSGTAPNLNAPIGSLHICGLVCFKKKIVSDYKNGPTEVEKPEAQMECTGPKGKRPVQAIKGGGAVEEHGISHQLPRITSYSSYHFQVARSSLHNM